MQTILLSYILYILSYIQYTVSIARIKNVYIFYTYMYLLYNCLTYLTIHMHVNS
jgi:hypothetical protein